MKRVLFGISFFLGLFLQGCGVPVEVSEGEGSGGVEIVTPQSKAQVKKDSIFEIKWRNIQGTKALELKIELYKGDRLTSILSFRVNAEGTYRWTPPSHLEKGSDYRLKFVSLSDSALYNYSAFFSITSRYEGTYTLLSPQKGDILKNGESVLINWTAVGTLGAYTKIELYRDSLQVGTLTSSALSSSYTWNIGSLLPSSTHYQIRISSAADNSLYAVSQKFVIQGLEPDSYEKDDTRNTARSITLGKIQNRSLHSGDVDWIKLKVSAGRFYMILDSGINVLKKVYRGNESSILKSFYSSNKSNVWKATTSGFYFLKIERSNAYGRYTIIVKEVEDVHISSPDSSTVWSSSVPKLVVWNDSMKLLGGWVRLKLYQDTTFITDISNSTTLNSYH